MEKKSTPKHRFSLEVAPHRDRLLTRRFAALWELDERWSRVTGEVPNFNANPLLLLRTTRATCSEILSLTLSRGRGTEQRSGLASPSAQRLETSGSMSSSKVGGG